MYEFDGGLQVTSTDVVDRGDVFTLRGASGIAAHVCLVKLSMIN